MRILDEARTRVEALLTAPGAELGRWARFVRFQIRLWRTCVKRLVEHNALAMSSALSFQTIFALIPLLVLSVLVVKSVGVLDDERGNLRAVLSKAGFELIRLTGEPSAATLPATAPATQPLIVPEMISVAERIETLVFMAGEKLTFKRIGPIGVAVLIWTAMTLLTTMERSLNRIFGAPRSRGLGRRVLLYWSAMTLGPIFMGVALYGASRAREALASAPILGLLVGAIGWAGSVILGIILLAALYKLMPNTQVRYSAAVGGAIVAVPLWLLAKWGFSVYVQNVGSNIYGALGLLPLFLFWVNVSWMIFLFGAELAHTAVNLDEMTSTELLEEVIVGPREVVATASAVALAHQSGAGPLGLAEAARQTNLPQALVRRILERLIEAGAIVATSDVPPAYVLAMAPERVGLTTLIGLGAAGRAGGPVWQVGTGVVEAVDRVTARTEEALAAMTLADAVARKTDR